MRSLAIYAEQNDCVCAVYKAYPLIFFKIIPSFLSSPLFRNGELLLYRKQPIFCVRRKTLAFFRKEGYNKDMKTPHQNVRRVKLSILPKTFVFLQNLALDGVVALSGTFM